MIRSLALKLTLAFVGVSLLGIALVAAFAGQFSAREFEDFMWRQGETSIAAEMADFYRARGSWDGLEASGLLSDNPPAHRPEWSRGRGLALADAAGRVVAPGPGRPHHQQLSDADLRSAVPVEVDGDVVGYLLFPRRADRPPPLAAASAVARINWGLALAALGAAVIALIIGGLLARNLTRPIRALTHASHRIAAGDLEQQVDVRSRDEIGELASAFNRMSADLARASRLRRQMTADVAHELRTPLSLIQAHAEALRDGVLPPSPETFSLIHDEAVRLNRLVADLRTLSLADAGELGLVLRLTPPGPLLERSVAAQAVRAQQQAVDLRAEVQPDLPDVSMDPDRMAQVLGNLIDNALRHTPPQGSITCRAARDGAGVAFVVADTGPGIAPEDLANLFERFYRADPSRQRDGSGTGLGLAIARSIVEAPGGRIQAESQPGHGAVFTVLLPPG